MVRDWPGGASGAPTPGRYANGWPTSDATNIVTDDRLNMPRNGLEPNAAHFALSGRGALRFPHDLHESLATFGRGPLAGGLIHIEDHLEPSHIASLT